MGDDREVCVLVLPASVSAGDVPFTLSLGPSAGTRVDSLRREETITDKAVLGYEDASLGNTSLRRDPMGIRGQLAAYRSGRAVTEPQRSRVILRLGRCRSSVKFMGIQCGKLYQLIITCTLPTLLALI